MFLGEYTHTIDDKGRLTIPSKFRPYVEEGLVITRGLDRCIAAYTIEDWNSLVDKVMSLPSTPKPSREYARLIFSAASHVKMDGQGRILIPSVLANYAQIDSESTVIGVNNRFEIWSPKRWEEHRLALEEKADDIAEALAEYGIAI
jgi:MraZ protein